MAVRCVKDAGWCAELHAGPLGGKTPPTKSWIWHLESDAKWEIKLHMEPARFAFRMGRIQLRMDSGKSCSKPYNKYGVWWHPLSFDDWRSGLH